VAKLECVRDAAVIVVSHGERAWLRACLESVLASGGALDLEVIVVCNGNDGSAELVESEFPAVIALRCENHGFAHANNLGIRASDSRYVVLLNADTEVRSGEFADLVRALDERPCVGVAGVIQISSEGRLQPTIRRFPNVWRTLGEALGSESWPVRPSMFGERELDASRYTREQVCDWMSGSFLAFRRSAIESVGLLDERFFLYAEEPDICLRLVREGWQVRHVPVMTVVHHAGRGAENERLLAQNAFARSQLAAKHFSRLHRLAFLAVLSGGYAIRATVPIGRSRSRRRREASRAALRVLLGLDPPPFDEERQPVGVGAGRRTSG
jgi:N-acetylglucosaminyl-diphospho-decaprenol L-rhamnosyltransferase